jgi:hypothetical protein
LYFIFFHILHVQFHIGRIANVAREISATRRPGHKSTTQAKNKTEQTEDIQLIQFFYQLIPDLHYFTLISDRYQFL